ncbi:MAG: dethiobiotin synthase [Alphaproteobacteria bacterium]|nr:dethiobiotin synthase [Alphaproteobacteria bacterium]
MPLVWIAGAGTDLGKTYVAAALLRALRQRGLQPDALKPVASGYSRDTAADSDPGRLLAALGRPIDDANLEQICPLRFAAPLSPPLAARMEGRIIAFDSVAGMVRARMAASGRQLLLVETAGGVMSPLTDSDTMLDFMAACPAPVVLIGGSYLGAISHTLTALAVTRAAGLPVAAVALSQSAEPAPPFDETAASLGAFAGNTPVLCFPRDAGADAAADALADAVLHAVGSGLT